MAHGRKRRQEGPHVRFENNVDSGMRSSGDEGGLNSRYNSESKYTPAHELYEANSGFGTPTTPSLTSRISVPIKDNSLPGSPLVGNPTFPLADMSSMMFPNPDPFAYPNQQSGADAKFNDLLKNLQSTPLQGSLDQYRVDQTVPESNDFVSSNPPQSFMILQDLPQAQSQPSVSQEADVQLLGPMPMYMMQGSAGGGSYNPYENMMSGSPSTPNVNGSPIPDAASRPHLQHVRPQTGQFRNQANKRTGLAPNVNLGELLGGSEWTGLPPDRTVYPNTQNEFEIQNTTPGPSQTNEAFGDMNQNILSWGLEGY